MTCLNIGCPLGTGIWEGVPLRELFWRTEPLRDIRRVYYHGYHNDDPEQMFRSSLPVDRVLEDPYDLPPVILCYKLNGQWLTPERGGPVRMVVPEAYGFKSVKWLQQIVISNLYHANDTYANGNNDVDSRQKTWAATLSIPADTMGFDQGKPVQWPLRLTKVHWATLLAGLPPGQYTFRSRTIDEKGIAQPLPRPFHKSGHAAIEQVPIVVEA